jgi:hypothetical protein
MSGDRALETGRIQCGAFGATAVSSCAAAPGKSHATDGNPRPAAFENEASSMA